MVLPVVLTLGLSSITTWLPRAANMADKQCVKAAIGVYRAPRRQRWSSLETTSAASAPLPASLAAAMCSRTIESCVLQLSVGLRKRNCEADHILRAHKTRMSAGASDMTRTGGEGRWRPHASGLEGRQDEWRPRSLKVFDLQVALPPRPPLTGEMAPMFQLAVHAVLVRVGALRPDLDQYNQRKVLVVLVPVRPHGMDGRDRNRYRKSGLRKIDRNPQTRTT